MKNSSKYNLYNCFCWRFGNRCCLRQNDYTRCRCSGQ